jgi:tRNA(Arg) A34 adenosine deaminase TadA
MGDSSEAIEASGGNGTRKAHHVSISPQEDSRGAEEKVGWGACASEESGVGSSAVWEKMIPPTYKPKKKFMQLAIAEAKRARDRGDYAIGAVVTRLVGKREVVIASAGNRVKTSGSSIKHVELETLKYVSSGYGRYLPDFVLYSTHEPCAMCAGACVWSKIGAVVFGVSQEDITAYGEKHGTEEFKWRACLISCKFVLERGGLHIPVFDHFMRLECQKLFGYRVS